MSALPTKKTQTQCVEFVQVNIGNTSTTSSDVCKGAFEQDSNIAMMPLLVY